MLNELNEWFTNWKATPGQCATVALIVCLGTCLPLIVSARHQDAEIQSLKQRMDALAAERKER